MNLGIWRKLANIFNPHGDTIESYQASYRDLFSFTYGLLVGTQASEENIKDLLKQLSKKKRK